MKTKPHSIPQACALLRSALAEHGIENCGIGSSRTLSHVEFSVQHRVYGDVAWLGKVPLADAEPFAVALLAELAALRYGRARKAAA